MVELIFVALQISSFTEVPKPLMRSRHHLLHSTLRVAVVLCFGRPELLSGHPRVFRTEYQGSQRKEWRWSRWVNYVTKKELPNSSAARVSALRKWRLLENGPVYVKVGSPLTRLGKTIFLWLRGY